MYPTQNKGRFIGVLFLLVMISWTIGDTLVSAVLNDPDYLTLAHSNKVKLITGVLFEIIDVIAVIGISVIMVPIIKKRNESLALAYLSFRILECIPLLIGLISPIVLISLSKEFVLAGSTETSLYHTIGAILLELRVHWSILVNAIFYNLSALIFYFYLYQLKLVPRFISVWGLCAVGILFIDRMLFELFEITLGTISNLPILGLHLGLIEIFLGIWLVIKGFNISTDTTPEINLKNV